MSDLHVAFDSKSFLRSHWDLANVEKTQPALVAPGEDLPERRQRLTPRGVRGAVEEHFDLRIVALG